MAIVMHTYTGALDVASAGAATTTLLLWRTSDNSGCALVWLPEVERLGHDEHSHRGDKRKVNKLAGFIFDCAEGVFNLVEDRGESRFRCEYLPVMCGQEGAVKEPRRSKGGTLRI